MEKSTEKQNAKPYNEFEPSISTLFKNKSFGEEMKSNWIGSQPFEIAIKAIANVPSITTLRCNSILYSIDDCMKKIQSLFSNTEFSVRIHPFLKDIIEIEKLSKEILKPIQYQQKLLIDQRCSCYVLRGASIFCKGIMASTRFLESDKISVYYSKEQYSGGTVINEKEFSEVSKSLILIGNGIAKMSRKEALCAEEGIAIEMTELFAEGTFPFSFTTLNPSQFYPQNIGSALVAHLLEPKEGEFMLDACAAPGGKTTHLAILANNKCRIIAIDKSNDRLKSLLKTSTEHGINSIECYKGDATQVLKLGSTLKNDQEKAVTFSEEMFDKIVVDPPCSSLGVKPLFDDISNTMKEIKHLATVQRDILANAFKLLKKGGLFSYSTCTITPWQNEELVR